MKRMFIIANWKSNKVEAEVKEWIERFTNYDLRIENKEIIICPSFLHLPILKSYVLNHKSFIKLGAQDISPFEEGAYTGEVNGEQIKEFADYIIINHSERRRYFSEDGETVTKKVSMAKKYNLTPIFCVQENDTFIPQDVEIVAYEPVFAIGSGNPDTPENAERAAKIIKKSGVDYVLYGGSVTSKNVREFTQMPNIDGVLVGGASLDPLEFAEIVKNA